MSRPLTAHSLPVAAALLLLTASSTVPFTTPLHAQTNPYLVVLTTGETLKALEKPSVQGKLALVLVWPDGDRSTVPASKIDWAATQKANAAPKPTPTLTSWDLANLHGRPSLKRVAAKTSVDGNEAAARSGAFGKIQTKDGEAIVVQHDGLQRASNSVLDHVQVTRMSIDQACTMTITLQNVSGFKLVHLIAYVQVPYPDWEEHTADVQTLTLHMPALLPGDEADVSAPVSCFGSPEARIRLRDVTGTIAKSYAVSESAARPLSVPTRTPTAPPRPAPSPKP